MKLFSILAATFIALAPAAVAAGCNKETANACQEGFTWDHEAQACVEIVTG